MSSSPHTFANPIPYPEIPRRDDAANDTYIFKQYSGGLAKVRFPDYRLAYEGINLPNIAVFKEQIDLLKEFMVKATPDAEQRANMDYMLALGEMFALIVYGQLIVENCKIYNIENDLIDQIFGLLVTDFSHFAMTQIAKSGNNGEQEKYLWQMLKKPAINAAREMRIWTDHVEVLNGSYTMNP